MPSSPIRRRELRRESARVADAAYLDRVEKEAKRAADRECRTYVVYRSQRGCWSYKALGDVYREGVLERAEYWVYPDWRRIQKAGIQE